MVAGSLSQDGLRASFSVTRPSGFDLEMALTVARGETAVVLGPNGAGKSTVVAAMAGLLPVDEGIIELDGVVLDDPARDIFVPAEDRNVGVVFQDYLLFPHLSVIENVAFGLRSRGVGRQEALERASTWLQHVGLGGLERRRPGDVSGGQAQRVALARALVTEPDLLLLDEPLSALDVSTRSELRRSLAGHLGVFDGPRLLITHDPTEAFLLADEIHVIEGGRVTQHGLPDDIRLRPQSRYAADLAGVNLFTGVASTGEVEIGGHRIQIADRGIRGTVLVIIQPAAVSVHLRQPEGSPRNSWATRVDLLEDLGDRVRLRTSAPLPLTVELTARSSDDLGLRPGAEVWLAIKATEIGVEPSG